ncbi:hypothetical protein NA57DRAFT_80384 [Rhizodiscina lignyota]|uniref:Magnesium transporter n=1 Tax=Rhizodiscina lignyota TaxID=1504668 RepID=A0A9P4I818_9PEZI|nr:hypothetical protein NA57DRAFT_80384 [Rhizodiscina lignyota]
MGLLSNSLNLTGVIFLTHAVYSAYEHSLLTSSSSSSSSSGEITSLPLDITIETLLSLLVLCTGIVIGAPSLRPIQWAVWASSVEKEDHVSLEQRRALVEEKVRAGGTVGNPFAVLDQRNGFLDIRAKRREFADWVREGGAAK